jgi:hypothetical protein
MFELDLQKAVYLALSDMISAPVYDHVPQDTPYPYVVIGEDNFVDWSTDDKNGFEATVNIHVWHRPEGDSGSRGRSAVKVIQGEIYGILQRSSFDIGAYGNPGMSYEYSDCFLDTDGTTYHGVQRFRDNFAEKNEFILGQCQGV